MPLSIGEYFIAAGEHGGNGNLQELGGGGVGGGGGAGGGI